MAITTTLSSASAASADESLLLLSDYEKLRLGKIKRNEDRMKELGLFKSKDALSSSLQKNKTKKKKTIKSSSQVVVSPDIPQRRSSRKRKSVVNYSTERVIPIHDDDDEDNEKTDNGSDEDEEDDEDNGEDDYEITEDDNDNDDEEDADADAYLKARPEKKQRKNDTTTKIASPTNNDVKKATTNTTALDTTFDCPDNNNKGGLTFEYAKTGRSTCRKCRLKIGKGKPRVGMEAWIVGRNCITWQCPECLLQNLCCGYEKSNGGRGRCKATHKGFQKGQLKIGVRCHTATSYYHIDAVAGVLNNVVSLMATYDDVCGNNPRNEFKHTIFIDAIEGNERLSEEDREKLESVLETASENQQQQQQDQVTDSDDIIDKKEKEKDKKSPALAAVAKKKKTMTKTKREEQQQEQPKVGVKSGAKGKVEWKFGGRSCYGTLLPSKETKTHCYARTHKGNVKTLAKGKDYWSMI